MSTSLPYTKIPYAADRSWSIVSGCTPLSAGCEHCWAQAMLRRFPAMGGTEVRCWPERLAQPSHTRKPSVVFVAPMGDLFHEDVPDEFLTRVGRAMLYHHPQAPLSDGVAHTFLLLTKRAQRASEWFRYATERLEPEFSTPDIWFGVSVEDQATADERVPLLLESGWPNLWVSVEPLLGPVSLKPWLDRIGWVVDGCEGGQGYRPCDPDWQDTLYHECRAAGVTHYSKQHRWSTADVPPGYGELVKVSPAPNDLPFRLAKWGPAE